MEYKQRFGFRHIALSMLLTSMIAFPIVLSACSPTSQEQARPKEPKPEDAEPEAEPRKTEMPSTCTLLGCSDTLTVKVTGELPGYISNDFIVEVKKLSGDVLAIQCLGYSRMSGSYGSPAYPLNAPEVEKISRISSVQNLCGSDTGYVGYASKHNGAIQWIVVQCFEPAMRDLSYSASCIGQAATFFEGFAPRNAIITVYWEGNEKTEKVTPSCNTYRPNGRGCSPTCRSCSVTIEIP